MIGKNTTRAIFYPRTKLYEELVKEAEKESKKRKDDISFSKLMSEIGEDFIEKRKKLRS